MVGSASAFPMAFPDGPQGPLPIPRPGSDGSYAGDNYFQYINVPAHKTFEWGYRRGSPSHIRGPPGEAKVKESLELERYIKLIPT